MHSLTMYRMACSLIAFASASHADRRWTKSGTQQLSRVWKMYRENCAQLNNKILLAYIIQQNYFEHLHHNHMTDQTSIPCRQAQSYSSAE